MNKESKVNLKKIISFILIILIIPIASGLGLAYFSHLQIEGNFAAWKPLGSPPERVSQIIGFCDDNVCVETVNATKYYNCGNYEDCWIKAELSPEEIKTYTLDPYVACMYEIRKPSLPPNTIQLVEMKYCSSGGVEQIYYALQQDGSIWVWNHTVADLAGLLLIGALVAGVQLGIVLDIVLITAILFLNAVRPN
jgi:hypothetical protein